MEFRGDRIARETIDGAKTWEAPAVAGHPDLVEGPT
jgi:hypothetical protein